MSTLKLYLSTRQLLLVLAAFFVALPLAVLLLAFCFNIIIGLFGVFWTSIFIYIIIFSLVVSMVESVRLFIPTKGTSKDEFEQTRYRSHGAVEDEDYEIQNDVLQ